MAAARTRNKVIRIKVDGEVAIIRIVAPQDVPVETTTFRTKVGGGRMETEKKTVQPAEEAKAVVTIMANPAVAAARGVEAE
jgi:hypothetical protein